MFEKRWTKCVDGKRDYVEKYNVFLTENESFIFMPITFHLSLVYTKLRLTYPQIFTSRVEALVSVDQPFKEFSKGSGALRL